MTIVINGSVGAGGNNAKSDTRKIQKLLSEIFPLHSLIVGGDCGPKSIRRIKRFQKRFMAEPDGRVDPAGRTLRLLNTAAPGVQSDWSALGRAGKSEGLYWGGDWRSEQCRHDERKLHQHPAEELQDQ